MIICIVIFCLQFITFTVFGRNLKGCTNGMAFFVYGIFLTIVGLFIAEIILYSNSITAMNQVDFELLKYAADNKCTDGPLGRALGFFVDDFKYDAKIRNAGFAFCIISFIAELAIFVYASPLRVFLGEKFNCLKSFKEPPMFENRLSTMRGKVAEGLIKRFTLKR